MPEEDVHVGTGRVVFEATARPVGGQAGSSGSPGSDVAELREVLRAISEFLKELREPIKDLLSALTSALDGGKLGEDVAKFYRSLKESGLPEEVAIEMTKQYFRERLEAANVAGLLTRFLRKELLEEEERPAKRESSEH